MPLVDLNMDVGESFGRWTLGEDESALPHVSSANIACGMHAGDPLVMERTVRICSDKGISPGAHPGFPDLQGFGRREMRMTPSEIEAYILYQIGALREFVESFGLELSHVKPHGALYNISAVDMEVALAVARGVARAKGNLILVGLAGSLSLEAAGKVGIPWASEGFCDRAYNPDGTLMTRSKPDAVIRDTAAIAQRAVKMVKEGSLLSYDGSLIPLCVDTICIHGDTPGAAVIARTIRESLEKDGVTVAPVRQVLQSKR